MDKNYFSREQMPQKPPQLELFTFDRSTNGTFESHDPSLMKDPKSGWYYSYSTDAAITSTYEMGIQVRRSKDLIVWDYVGTALSEKAVLEGKDNGDFPPTGGFWAPFVEYVNHEYRMYYSATKAFGSSESRIWLAVANKPEGPFENRGVVMDTWFTDDTLPNAIDAHIIDTIEGKKYLVYGSFFGGIFIKELNPLTGLAIGHVNDIGRCIAKKGESFREDGPEGPAIIYNNNTGYYYLFYSYGFLGENYDIRVGRSKSVEGPYMDYNGVNLLEEGMGTKLANSYMFEGANPHVAKHLEEEWSWGGFKGPGHGVPFYDDCTHNYYFIHHVRDGAKQFESIHEGRSSYRMHYLMVRKMVFINGWPVLSPEPYAGEDEGSIKKQDLLGMWEVICLDDESNDTKYSYKIQLELNNVVISFDRSTGIWSYEDMSNEMFIKIGEAVIKVKVMKCWDFENGRPTLCFTGLSCDGNSYWGKLVEY